MAPRQERAASVGKSSLRSDWSTATEWIVPRKGGSDDQVNCCCWLRLVGRDIRASYDARADSSAGRHDFANCRRLRPGQDNGERCVRGKNHHSPDPPRRPQVCAMAGRRLRLVRVNATELVGLEQTGRQFRACGSRAFLLCGVCTSRHPVPRIGPNAKCRRTVK
jgi:hypothetical protein